MIYVYAKTTQGRNSSLSRRCVRSKLAGHVPNVFTFNWSPHVNKVMGFHFL